MRVVFIGSSKSSEILLNKSLKLGLNIVGICTKNKSFNYDFIDLKKKFLKKNIPTTYVNNINSHKISRWIKKKKPDLIFCFGWSQILKKNIYSLPRIATIGFHPTELPKNRGRHPIIWSLVLGLKKTASSFFIIDSEKPDSGTIISQKIIKIMDNDNATTLYKKIIKKSSDQLQQIIIFFKKKRKLVKNKIFKSNSWRKRNYDDGRIDWRMSSKNIFNLVRALQKPYMYAHFFLNNEEFKILRCKIIRFKDKKNDLNIEPGKVLLKRKSFFDVKCGEGVIRVLKTNKTINLNKLRYL